MKDVIGEFSPAAAAGSGPELGLVGCSLAGGLRGGERERRSNLDERFTSDSV